MSALGRMTDVIRHEADVQGVVSVGFQTDALSRFAPTSSGGEFRNGGSLDDRPPRTI
jgi:hypothetical protein